MSIQCIALDLDRTTLDKDGTLAEKTKQAIEAAIHAGIQIVVASGRALRSLPQDVLSIKGIRYAITSNGAAVYDLHTGECLHQYKMTEHSVKQILELTADYSVGFEIFIDGQPYGQKEYVEDPVKFGASEKAIPYIQGTRKPVPYFREFILKHCSEIDCLDIVVPTGAIKEQVLSLIQNDVDDIYITSSVQQLLEISYKECGKHAGARYLLQLLGLKREELAAFGDGDNDAELLSYAGIGFAVENASDKCKASADIIAPSNEEFGVAWGITQILEDEKNIDRRGK